MATTIISVSVPLELAKFLEENPELSPSKVLQERLYSIMTEEFKLQQRVKAYETRLFTATGKLNRILEYCEQQKVIIPNNVLG